MRIIGDFLIWIRDFTKDDDRIKFIFDNVRNFIVSGLVIAAGVYEAEFVLLLWAQPPWLSPAFKVFYVAFAATCSATLLIFGLALAFLNTAHAGRKFAERMPPLAVWVMLALLYGSLSVLVTATVLSRFLASNQ